MTHIIFIDGENFRHRIKEVFDKVKETAPDWSAYDFAGLLDCVLTENQKNYERRFYRAKPNPHGDIPELSAQLMLSYRNLGGHLNRQGFELITAGVLRADYKKPGDKKPIFREKGVDVSISVDMLSLACDGKLTEAFLVASDSDYQPVVRELKKRGVRVVYVGFEVNPNLGLIAKTDDRIIISSKEVLGCAKQNRMKRNAA